MEEDKGRYYMHVLQRHLVLEAAALPAEEAALLYQELADWAYSQAEVCLYKANTETDHSEEK